MADDFASILQTVDDCVDAPFKVSTALENLFKRSGDHQQQNTTPSRQFLAMDWAEFGKLVAALVCYTSDLPYGEYIHAWDSPLFDDVRKQLVDDSSDAADVNYGKTIPELRIYKDYTQVIRELEIRPHPLELALQNTNLTFTALTQSEILKSFKEAFSAACRFRQVHTDCTERQKDLWAKYSDAELAYKTAIEGEAIEEALGIVSDEDGAIDCELDERMSLEELTSRAQKMQAEQAELSRQLKERKMQFEKLQAEDKKLDSKLEPLQRRIAEFQTGLSRLSHELERRATRPQITPEDVERIKDQLTLLQQRDAAQRQEAKSLEEKISETRANVQSMIELLKENMIPLGTYIQSYVVPAATSYTKSCQNATGIHALITSTEANQQNDDRINRREIGEAESKISLAEQNSKQKGKELAELRALNNELRSVEHAQSIARKQRKCEELTHAASQELRINRELKSKFEKQTLNASKLLADYEFFLQNIGEHQTVYAQKNAAELSKAIKNVTEQLTQLT